MTDPPRRPRRTVSPERKGLYMAGLGLQVLGGIGFLVCFLGFATGGMQSVSSFGREGNSHTDVAIVEDHRRPG